MKKVTAVMIGAGARGIFAYGVYANKRPDQLEFVAVAEPDDEKREFFKKQHNISDDMCFTDWKDILDKGKLADCAIIATNDRMHYEPTLKALDLGYHILLEKPMTPDPKECIELGEKADEMGRILSICHVLRYTPFYKALKNVLSSNRIGKLISVTHSENVGYYHIAHSFVRGHWRNSEETSPMILAKCCHDMDILTWLIDSPCKKISSFGSLEYFKRENAPEGSPDRCIDGCPEEDTCPYNAPRLYLGGDAKVFVPFITVDTSTDAVTKVLKESQFGRCVFKCDNNVVDHQVANIEFENGVTVAFTMCGFTKECSRTMKFMGTKGEIRAHMEKNIIEVADFATGSVETIKVSASNEGHGGGDYGIMKDFVNLVKNDGKTESLSSASKSVQSHLMSFAAEHSRVTNTIVDIKQFIESFKN